MMKNSGARRFSKRCHTANPPPTGSTIINKIPKNRYFANASRHSFCFLAVATIASFRFKILPLFKICAMYFAPEANFSKIYAAKIRRRE